MYNTDNTKKSWNATREHVGPRFYMEINPNRGTKYSSIHREPCYEVSGSGTGQNFPFDYSYQVGQNSVNFKIKLIKFKKKTIILNYLKYFILSVELYYQNYDRKLIDRYVDLYF